jgi:HK97 family phage major capsid protein
MKKEHLDAQYAHQTRSRALWRGGLLGLGILCVLGLLCSPLVAGLVAVDPTGGTMTAGLGLPLCLIGAGMGLMKEDGGPDGGGAGDDVDDPLAKKILAAIADAKSQVADVERRVGEISETKAEAEELQKAVKNFDGLSSDVKDFFDKLRKLETKLQNVRREVSGDPVVRLANDEEMRTLITAPARVAYLRNHNKAVSKELLDAAERFAELLGGKALTGGASPGSNYIHEELISTVYQLIASYGRWAGFDVLRPGARTVRIPVDTSDPEMVWATEGVAPPEAAYTGTRKTLNIRKIFGWLGIANELLEDDEIGLATHISTKFARATSKKLDQACFVGDGTADAVVGGYTGIFEGGTARVATGATEVDDLAFLHFIQLVAGCDEALVESPSTRWWTHPQMLVRLLGIRDGNGRPIFLTALEAPAAGGLGSILGYPVLTTNTGPKADEEGAPVIAFGDSNGLAVAVRRDMEMASSVDAKFTEDQTVFRCRMRAGVEIKLDTAFEVLHLDQGT